MLGLTAKIPHEYKVSHTVLTVLPQAILFEVIAYHRGDRAQFTYILQHFVVGINLCVTFNILDFEVIVIRHELLVNFGVWLLIVIVFLLLLGISYFNLLIVIVFLLIIFANDNPDCTKHNSKYRSFPF